MLVVQRINHKPHHQGLEVRQVHYKAGLGIDLALHGYPNLKIVSVTKLPRTLAKQLLVLLGAKGIIIEPVRCTKHLAALNVDHDLLCFNQLGLQGLARGQAKGHLCRSSVLGCRNSNAQG